MPESAMRLILDWIPPNVDRPLYVDRRAYGACNTCGQTFRSRPIHCSLCGELFDERCTAKYDLPDRFQAPGAKPGPGRVCFGCRNRCMAWRDAQLGMNLTDARRPLFKCDVVDGVLHIYPPVEWAAAARDDACSTCARMGSVKRHHCLACGELFCGDCSSKMIVPEAFNRKHKSGPQRVCDECRFLVIRGAVLSEPIALEDERKQFVNVFEERRPSGRASPKRANVKADEEPTLSPNEPVVALRLVWHDSLAVIGEIRCGLHWDLDVIDKVVRRLDVAGGTAYVYTYRQRPIAVEHWTAFTAKALNPDLILRSPESFVLRWTAPASSPAATTMA